MSGDVLVTGDGTLADLAWPVVATAVRSATFVALSLRATVSARDCERALVHGSGPFLEQTTETGWYGHGQSLCSPFVLDGAGARDHPEAAALERRYAVYRDWILRQSVVELGLATFRRKPVDRSRHTAKEVGKRESLEASRDALKRVSAGAGDSAAKAPAAVAPAAFDVQTFRFIFIMDHGDDTPVVSCFLATPTALKQLSGHARDRPGYRSDGCWRGKPATASEQLFDSDSGESDETDDVDAELVTASASTSAYQSTTSKGDHRETATTSRCREARAHSENVLSFALRQGIRYVPPRWQLLDREREPSNAATMPLQLRAFPDTQPHRTQYAGEIRELSTRVHVREPTPHSLVGNEVSSSSWDASNEWMPLPPTLAQGEGAHLFRMLAESHIPLVFFDGLYDIMSLYEAFYAPLPPSLDAFLSRLAMTMPQVMDVGCLAALMKLSEKRSERVPDMAATTPQLSGDGLLARMVRIALRSAIVNHRHLLQSIRGGKWFVNHPRSKALRREAQALEEKRAVIRVPSLQTTDGRLPSPISGTEDEGLSGQAAEGAPAPLPSIHLDEMLSENNEPTANDAFASLLLVPLAKGPENHTENNVMTTSTELEPLPELDPFSDAPLNPTDAQELLAALEDTESTADVTTDSNLLPETLFEHMSGAALRAFRTGAVLAYLLERHGWSTVMDRFRGCIATGSDHRPVYLPRNRGEGDKSTSPKSTDPTSTPTEAVNDHETQACMQRPTSTSKMTHGITEDLNGRLAAGQLKDNRSTETPIRICENRSVSQVSSGPIPTPDARTRSEPIDWVTHHATAVLPLPGFVAVDTMTSVQRTRDPAFIPDDPLTYEWTQRLVSLIAPNTYTEALHERALLTVGSVAQGSLGAHTFAIGAHTEKTYLWESDLDIGIFLAGFDPPEASDDTECVQTATPAAPLETAPGTRTRLAGVVDDPDRPPAPNDAWPVRIASALCEAAARLAYRQPQIVAAPNDPLNATRMTAPSCCASDAADAMAGMPRFAASASACPRAGRGMTLQPPIRRRSRRRRRHRREDTAASAVSLPAEVSCLSLSEQGVACRLASDGDASAACVPEPDHLVCADVTVPGCSHSSSGEEQSPERRLSGLVRDRSEARQADTDADLVPGLESIDSLTIERAVNAGMSGLVIRCAVNGLSVRLMLNPATALCRSLFLAECDEIIGHRHIFIRCLLLLKAWWRYSPATSQVKAAQPRSVQSLSSALLAALLLSYLNSVGHPSEHPVQVLHGLFQFYGFELDWSRYGMSIHGPYEGEQGSLLTVSSSSSSSSSSRLPLLPLGTLRSHLIEYASCCSSRTSAEAASYRRWRRGSDSGVDAGLGAVNSAFRNRNAFQSTEQVSPFFLNVLDPLDPEWNIGLQAMPTPALAQAFREAFRLAASQFWSFRQYPTRESLEACWGVSRALEPVWSLICNVLGNDAALLLQRAFDDTSSDHSFNEDTGDVFDEHEGGFGPTRRRDASTRFWSLLRLYGLGPARHLTREQQGAGGGIALHGTGNYSDADIDGGLFILPDVAQLKEHLAYVRFLVQFDTSEAGILAFLLQTLRRSRSLLVGELGQQLRSRMSKHAWQMLFKTRYGGLKRFLERHSDLFCIERDHPLNPHVSLRF